MIEVTSMLKHKTQNQLIAFQDKSIRRVWDNKSEQWCFSVVDIVGVLSQSADPQNYWKVLKNRLRKEGSEVVTKCNHLKMMASDGKYYQTDSADVETLLRLIQSIPSPRAEPFKLWLAKVGYERLQETVDPEKSLNRARENWQKLGRSPKWVEQRMTGQETRNKLTDYWKTHGVKEGSEFALLTNVIHQEWAGLTVAEHKKLKDLKSENLRDHMSEAELIFTALAEFSTRQFAQSDNAEGLPQNITAGKKGGNITKRVRLELEQRTGKKVITNDNFKPSLRDSNEYLKISE